MNELPDDKPYERMFKEKIRSVIDEKTRKATEERERLTSFLLQLSKRAGYRRLRIVEKERRGFPMKIIGEVFYPGDGITAVVGDVEVPAGAVLDRPLVVKGRIKIGSKCQVLKELKALEGISIAEGCLVKGDLECGGIIELAEDIAVEGNVPAESSMKLSQGVEIYGLVDVGGAYVTVGSPASEALGSGEEENGKHNH